MLVALTMLLAGLVAAGATTATQAAAPAPKPKKPAITVKPARPLQGTRATFRLKLPTKVKRPVVLQRKVGGRWVRVAKGKSKRNGKVVLKRVVVPGEGQWRVRAKAVKVKGKRLKAVVSKTRRVDVVLRAELASKASDGRSSGIKSAGASISANGRYVAFASSAPLVPGVTGYVAEREQVFVRDRVTGTTTLVSHQGGDPTTAGNNMSYRAVISADGRYVCFVSYASDLGPSDSGGHQDVFRYDRQTGTVIRASRNLVGDAPNADSHDPSMSPDGSIIAFSTEATDLSVDDTNGVSDVYVWQAPGAGPLELMSRDVLGDVANGPSGSPIVSANGTFVSFSSAASDLVVGDTNGKRDIFRRNLTAGTNAIVSRGFSEGGDDNATGGPSAISPDGRYVAFASLADNLVEGGSPDSGKLNVFVRDMTAGSTVLVSRHPRGVATTGHSLPPSWVSADGRRLIYTTVASELVAGGDANGDAADALMWDRAAGRSTPLLTDRYGTQPDGPVYEPVLSADGRWLAFYSTAPDLVPEDTNTESDVFVWRMP